MKKIKSFILYVHILLFIIYPIFLCPNNVYAREAYIKDITTNIKHNYLMISFKVTNCFTDKMIQAIKNGVNTRFVFLIRLYKVKKWWKDKKITDLKVIHAVQYDSIKKIYKVQLSESNPKEVCLKNIEQAKKMLAHISNLKVINLKGLKKGEIYQLRLKAELDKIKLPLHLHYVLFFLSLWNFDTKWYKVNIIY